MPAPERRVFVHVGPAKTGTTYLQAVVEHNETEVTRRGVDIPLGDVGRHFPAALDLRGQHFKGHADPRTRGTWDRLVAAVARGRRPKALISHELLGRATREQIARLVDDLAPAQVHVVFGARDLARQLPALWQESVKNRGVRPYDEYLERAFSRLRRDETDRGFWQGQHHAAVLARWVEHVPADRIHVITLPQRGAPRELLWQRFCAALDLDPAGFDLRVERVNASLSAEETEVLRLVNQALPDSEELPWPAYERLVKRQFNLRADHGSTGTRLTVPERLRDEVLAYTTAVTKELDAAGYRVIGTLDDLEPPADSFGRAIDFAGPEVSEAAARLLAEVLLQSRPRRRRGPTGQVGPIRSVRRQTRQVLLRIRGVR